MSPRTRKRVDKVLLILVAALVGVGFFVFASASLGLLARGSVSVTSIAFNHLLLGIVGGVVAMFVASRINYRLWKKWAPYLYGAALFVTALVFIPGLGLESGGAQRWLLIGPLSFQPGEALKIATLLMLAATLAKYRVYLQDWRYSLGIFAAVLAPVSLVLLLQPDTGTFGIIAIASGAMLFAAGVKWRDIGVIALSGLILLALLSFARPYVLDRITTFMNPFSDPQGSSYQIQQSLIAVGSGGVTGRGFGQSVQKFSYLPEPMSDSIFAVAAEEFGLIGSLFIVGLFGALAARGLFVAARAPDYFGGLLAVGITAYIVGQAFVNIGAILGLLPLTGIPLVFISQGGTAMLIALGSIGILLSISRYAQAR